MIITREALKFHVNFKIITSLMSSSVMLKFCDFLCSFVTYLLTRQRTTLKKLMNNFYMTSLLLIWHNFHFNKKIMCFQITRNICSQLSSCPHQKPWLLSFSCTEKSLQRLLVWVSCWTEVELWHPHQSKRSTVYLEKICLTDWFSGWDE